MAIVNRLPLTFSDIRHGLRLIQRRIHDVVDISRMTRPFVLLCALM